MFGFVIGGSGKLYLSVPMEVSGEWWSAWRPMYSPAEYRLFGRRGGSYRVLLNNPTLPHAMTGRPSDPPRHICNCTQALPAAGDYEPYVTAGCPIHGYC